MKKNMTDIEIAEVLATNNMTKKERAVDSLLKQYLKDISDKKEDIVVLNESFYSKIMHSPKSYARWLLNLTSEIIYLNTEYTGFVKNNINYTPSYTEFKFDIFNHKSQIDCDTEVSILISKNGIVVDFDGEYASISRNRSNPTVWNAKISEGLIEYLPLSKNNKNNKNKAKKLRIS